MIRRWRLDRFVDDEVKAKYRVASYPGRVGGENGLVSTVCACATFTRISGNPDSIAFYPRLSLGMRLR